MTVQANPPLSPAAFSYHTPATYAANAVCRALPLILLQCGGFNPSAAQMFVLVFDATAVPAASAVPLRAFLVPSLASYSWTPTAPIAPFASGLCFAVSSTGDVYTPLATPAYFFAEGYIQGAYP